MTEGATSHAPLQHALAFTHKPMGFSDGRAAPVTRLYRWPLLAAGYVRMSAL